MASAAVAAVKVLSVPRKKLAHHGRDPLLTALEEEMNVLCEAPDYVKLRPSLPPVCSFLPLAQ